MKIKKIKYFGVVVSVMLTATSVTAEQIELSCQNNKGWAPREVTVNLSDMILQENFFKYTITKVTTDHVFANYVSTPVATAVFVLDRNTGKFWRAEITTCCKDSSCNSTFTCTDTLEGTCSKKLF